jgi:protein tyrosine/serine phosphatase
LLAVAVLGGCGLGDMDEFAPLTPTDNFHVIKPGAAYRSAQLDPTTLEMLLTDLDIRTVINLRGENSGAPWYDAERETCAALGVEHVDIRMSAHELPPPETLLALYDTFENAEYPILMHCKAGADRTGAAAAVWRMQVEGDTRAAALQELSPAFGHLVFAAPEMDMLAQMFEPRRDWIVNEYGAP